MRSRYGLQQVLSLLVAALLAGCGSGGSTSTTTTPSGGGNFRERPGQQPTSLHLGAADCKALAATVARQAGSAVHRESEPTPPNSRCQLQGRGVRVSISLDTAYDARQRYENRMTEQVQFNAAYPDRDPHHVPGVGDRASGEHFASWIPAYSTLYAVRGNRWLTLAYSVAGKTRPQRLAAAAALARQAFKLSAQ
ncbi:MAG TPA: hypothetical protein VF009_06025 [Solirubrobacterales bacterium]